MDMWNFNGNRISFASNKQRETNVSTGRRKGELKIKDGGLEPGVDMK